VRSLSGTARGFGSPARTQILTLAASARQSGLMKLTKLIFGLIVFNLIFVTSLYCQTTKKIKIIKDFTDRPVNYDSLEKIYPSRHIDERFRNVFLVVRQYFPELTNNTIDLKFKSNSSRTISAKPRVNFFRGKSVRKYFIVIKSGSDDYVLENELNAQIGLIGHEFSHLADYSSKTNLSLMIFGIRYGLSKQFRIKTERNTDIEVIKRGLGWQLKSLHLYLKSSEIDEKMKEFGY
jgi:hypothetical protein